MFLTGKAPNRWCICKGTTPPLLSSPLHTEGWEEVTARRTFISREWDHRHVLRLPAHLRTSLSQAVMEQAWPPLHAKITLALLTLVSIRQSFAWAPRFLALVNSVRASQNQLETAGLKPQALLYTKEQMMPHPELNVLLAIYFLYKPLHQ